jgi:hypothetical protein
VNIIKGRLSGLGKELITPLHKKPAFTEYYIWLCTCGFFGMIYPTENGHEIWSSECHESLQIKYWKYGIAYDK